MSARTNRVLEEIAARLERVEREAELSRNILIVKEPTTGLAAEAYDGLRKQVVASAGERRSHLVQLAILATAVNRAGSIDDLRPLVREWLDQAGVRPLSEVPRGAHVQDLFEDVEGKGLAGAAAIEVLEPAYLDSATGVVLRLGRARQADIASAVPIDRLPAKVDVDAEPSALEDNDDPTIEGDAR